MTASNTSPSATVAATGSFLAAKKPSTMLKRVGYRIDDGIAKIIQRDGPSAVALDVPVGIFQQLPAAFDQHGDDQAAGPGQARQRKVCRAVEQKTVQEV